MGQRTQSAVGCLAALIGLAAGFTVWTLRADGRLNRFEQGPEWRVLAVDLPLYLIVGTALGVLAGALVPRLLGRR